MLDEDEVLLWHSVQGNTPFWQSQFLHRSDLLYYIKVLLQVNMINLLDILYGFQVPCLCYGRELVAHLLQRIQILASSLWLRLQLFHPLLCRVKNWDLVKLACLVLMASSKFLKLLPPSNLVPCPVKNQIESCYDMLLYTKYNYHMSMWSNILHRLTKILPKDCHKFAPKHYYISTHPQLVHVSWNFCARPKYCDRRTKRKHNYEPYIKVWGWCQLCTVVLLCREWIVELLDMCCYGIIFSNPIKLFQQWGSADHICKKKKQFPVST